MKRATAFTRVLALAALALVSNTNAATDIDTGFTQDGATTYCEGVTQDEGPLVFETLDASSAGKCPVSVQLSLSTTLVPSIYTQVTVNWTASVASDDLSTTLFPRILNETSGAPKNVIASLLRACKVGSNCATDSDVVVPAGVTSVSDSAGAFGEDGKKTMRSYVFQFPADGDYVVLGKVVLPGDAQLNISATEFVAFQHVTVGGATAGGEAVPGTVKPANGTGADRENFINAATPVPTTTGTSGSPASPESAVGVDAQGATGAGLSSSESKGSKTNVIVLSSIAAIGAVVALAYFVTVRKKQNRNNGMPGSTDDVDDARIYRLTDAAKATTSMKLPTKRAFERQRRSPQHKMAYPSRTVHEPVQLYQGPSFSVDCAGSSDPPPLTRRDLDSIDSNDELMMKSHTSSFGDLHDSAVTLPIVSRPRRASSASSYHDALDDSDHEEFNDKPGRLVSGVQFQDTQVFHDSTASWGYVGRDSEMSSISDLTSMHERLAR